MPERRQFYALYFTRFARSFGYIALVTLIPTYIDRFDPSGLVIGLFTTALMLTQTVAVVPIAWAGDRYDKRTVLLGSLALGVVTYVAFAFVSSSLDLILVRGLQGVAITGIGILGLALIGERAPVGERAKYIGTSNAWRFAAAIVGALAAAAVYQRFGFGAVYAALVGIIAVALVAVFRYVDPDTTAVEGFAFSDLAVNRRILTITSFRAQYAIAVTLVRNWVPIFAGVAAARGGLAYGALAVSVVVTAEKFTNMLCQPYTGRLSDRFGRSIFVSLGGTCYGLVALTVPFTPLLGAALPLPAGLPILGELSPAFLPLIALNGLLGVADSLREPASMALFADEGTDDGGVASSFGIRSLVWRPGSVLAPLLGGFLMANVGMESVFYVGAFTAFSGVGAFVGILGYTHGRGALARW